MGRIENIALPVFYFMLGFNLKLPFVAQRQYLRRVLKASPANQALVLNIIAQIPWQLKLFYAFLSDTVPIGGRRRKPYMIIGVILFISTSSSGSSGGDSGPQSQASTPYLTTSRQQATRQQQQTIVSLQTHRRWPPRCTLPTR